MELVRITKEFKFEMAYLYMVTMDCVNISRTFLQIMDHNQRESKT